jgi:hypothetical protein
VDVGERAAPTEVGRSEETTHQPETGSRGVGTECALGAETPAALSIGADLFDDTA